MNPALSAHQLASPSTNPSWIFDDWSVDAFEIENQAGHESGHPSKL